MQLMADNRAAASAGAGLPAGLPAGQPVGQPVGQPRFQPRFQPHGVLLWSTRFFLAMALGASLAPTKSLELT